MSEVTTARRMPDRLVPIRPSLAGRCISEPGSSSTTSAALIATRSNRHDALEGEELHASLLQQLLLLRFPCRARAAAMAGPCRKTCFKTHMGGQPVGALIAAFPQSTSRVPLERTDSSGDVAGCSEAGESKWYPNPTWGAAVAYFDRLARAGFTELCGADPPL